MSILFPYHFPMKVCCNYLQLVRLFQVYIVVLSINVMFLLIDQVEGRSRKDSISLASHTEFRLQIHHVGVRAIKYNHG